MTKRFELTPDLTCPELDGYKLPTIDSTRIPIAIEVEMERVVDYSATGRYNDFIVRRTDYKIGPTTHPDGTVKGVYVYE